MGLAALLSGGCDRTHKEYVSFSTSPVEQVFRDHDGYRIYFMGEKNQLSEYKVYTGYPNCFENGSSVIEGLPEKVKDMLVFTNNIEENKVRIIKDLKEGEHGYANIVAYKQVLCANPDRDQYYVEIHLSETQGLSPGNEIYGNRKNLKKDSMSEIK